MKLGILSLAATAALALSSGTASAQWVYSPPSQNYSVIVPSSNHLPLGPHLDYHNGHYHYHDGFYRSGPVVPYYGLDGSVGLAPVIRDDRLPGYYPLPSTGTWSSYNYGYSRGSAYGSYRWRW